MLLQASPLFLGGASSLRRRQRAKAVRTAASLDSAAGLPDPFPCSRPRPDVFDPSVHLRRMLAPRKSPWSDSFPFVPDDDLVSLRIIQHSATAFDSPSIHTWASAGGMWYDHNTSHPPIPVRLVADEDCVATLPDIPSPTPLPPFMSRPMLTASHVVRGGPREVIYFDGREVKAAIVTMGGLCPGLNDVVRSLVNGLTAYGVPDGNILGIRYGLRGFYATDHPPVVLTNASVETIHLLGGTVLGTSRGGADIPRIVDAIIAAGVNQVYGIGGNGGQSAVVALDAECRRRGYPCAVAGLPKRYD